MNVMIQILQGQNHSEKVTKQGIQKNIDALKRAIDGMPWQVTSCRYWIPRQFWSALSQN